MKTCTTCHRCLDIKQFRMTTKRGKPYRMPECADCVNAYKREKWKQAHPANPLNQAASLWFGPANRSEPLRPTP